jgi:hypothetical protein
VAIVEAQIGLPWPKLLAQSAGGGIVLAIDAPTRGVALLVRATDDATQMKLIETLTSLVRQDAANKGGPDPVKSGEYRSIRAYALDRAKYAVFDRWLVVTNQDELGKQIVDRWLDSTPGSLADDDSFRRAKAAAAGQALAWGYVSTTMVRKSGVAQQLFGGKADNPAAEVLLGGLLSTLQHTTHLTASLTLDANRLILEVSSPLDRAWAGEARAHFFGADGTGTAPALPLADPLLLAVGAYRDLSSMWLRAGDLFDEKTNEELAKADSGLTTLFGGKDFGEDILGALRPEIQLVAVRQAFAAGQPAPAIKLPAFALSAALKDPARMQPELRRTFQSLIGFLNIVGAMNGQPPLDQEMEKSETGQIIIARYLPDPNAKDPGALKINYNFSPTIAFEGERFVVSSSEQLARRLVASTATARPADDAGRVTNTDAAFRFDVLRDVLSDNRPQLVAQNMLSEGHTKEEAEKEIGMLLELLGWLDAATLRLDSTARDLRLSVSVTIK